MGSNNLLPIMFIIFPVWPFSLRSTSLCRTVPVLNYQSPVSDFSLVICTFEDSQFAGKQLCTRENEQSLDTFDVIPAGRNTDRLQTDHTMGTSKWPPPPRQLECRRV